MVTAARDVAAGVAADVAVDDGVDAEADVGADACVDAEAGVGAAVEDTAEVAVETTTAVACGPEGVGASTWAVGRVSMAVGVAAGVADADIEDVAIGMAVCSIGRAVG